MCVCVCVHGDGGMQKRRCYYLEWVHGGEDGLVMVCK